ncbi:hypothetical protein IGI04_042080 [Brassica rapa subsp. trilocularis]|uniref:Uncharacterized protein n=1 Tax=Brassica rapa subsp. trilocularis TaxID=1813537 RepID=A0ABQ7KSQ3_BRACM|nr:hypothetical protein IGI04_042080 [Brassica rapa subsp. trilocularis]
MITQSRLPGIFNNFLYHKMQATSPPAKESRRSTRPFTITLQAIVYGHKEKPCRNLHKYHSTDT